MDIKSLRKSSLDPFDKVAMIKKYFAAVKSMDSNALAGKRVDVDSILRLWGEKGTLTIKGPQPLGEQTFKGVKQLRGFYENRARGVDGVFKVNLSSINSAAARSAEQVLVAGARYVVNAAGEGMQIPFSHNFTISEDQITQLQITVGKAGKTNIAPLGTLSVQDLGRLSAMAWMVA
jgi:ketosteroid isomerase-like protein